MKTNTAEQTARPAYHASSSALGTWYTIRTAGCGVPACDPLPRGPWSSEAAAADAVDRWAEDAGSDAGTHLASSSARMMGPYATRRAALAADISTDYGKPL